MCLLHAEAGLADTHTRFLNDRRYCAWAQTQVTKLEE
jgi:hypothetical protein